MNRLRHGSAGNGGRRLSARQKSTNWRRVNIGRGEAEEMRALADCQGVTLQMFMLFGLRAAKREAERQIGVRAALVAAMPRQRRLYIDRARRALRRGFGHSASVN